MFWEWWSHLFESQSKSIHLCRKTCLHGNLWQRGEFFGRGSGPREAVRYVRGGELFGRGGGPREAVRYVRGGEFFGRGGGPRQAARDVRGGEFFSRGGGLRPDISDGLYRAAVSAEELPLSEGTRHSIGDGWTKSRKKAALLKF